MAFDLPPRTHTLMAPTVTCEYGHPRGETAACRECNRLAAKRYRDRKRAARNAPPTDDGLPKVAVYDDGPIWKLLDAYGYTTPRKRRTTPNSLGSFYDGP